MNYDIDEKQTSIDNMEDTLWERVKMHAIRDDLLTVKAIHDEWVVDGVDPTDGGVEFMFIENFAIEM